MSARAGLDRIVRYHQVRNTWETWLLEEFGDTLPRQSKWGLAIISLKCRTLSSFRQLGSWQRSIGLEHAL